MAIDVKTLATANLALQVLLVILLAWAAYLCRKKKLQKHCTIMRILVPVQIIAIIAVMLPSLLGYLKDEMPSTLFYSEMLAHHTTGIVVVALWIYINQVFGKPSMPRNFKAVMRLAFALWILAFLLGLHMYTLIYT